MTIDINILLTKIDKADFSIRTHNALLSAGYQIIAELVEIRKPNNLLRIPNFGKISLREVQEFLKLHGLSFGMNLIEIENYFGMSINQINEFLESLNINESRDQILNFETQNFKYEVPKKNPNFINLNTGDIREKSLFIKLSGIEFSKRVKNYFSNYEIFYVGDLIRLSKKDILRSNNTGTLTLREIENFLKDKDLRLSMDIDEWPPININNYIDKYTNIDDSLNSFWKDALSKNSIHDFSILENEIISDIDKLFEKLSEREKTVFKHRLGYQEKILTLEELGKLFNITRERIRQIEVKIYKKIPMCRTVNDEKLKIFLFRYESHGFVNIFPNLSNSFSNQNLNLNKEQSLSINSRSVLNNHLTNFIEAYLNLENVSFNTPERAAYEIFQNYYKIQSLYKDLKFPISKEDFSYLIADTLRIKEEATFNSLNYLEKLKIISINKNNEIYPFKISKRDEILSILSQYPLGIDNLKLFNLINSSPSKNIIENYHSGFATGSLDKSEYIICGKSKIKAVQFGKHHSIAHEEIFPLISTYLLEIGGVSNLNDIYERFKNYFKDEVDVFDLRYLINTEGIEYGIYFSGNSQSQSVSIGKKIRQNHKQEIETKINKSKKPVDLLALEDLFSGVSQLLKVKLSELVYEGKICRYDINEWCSNKVAYRNIDINNFKIALSESLNQKNYFTLTFIIEKLNNDLNIYESRYFIESLIKKINHDSNLKIHFRGEIITFLKNPKSMTNIIEDNLNDELSMDINYEIISNVLGIGLRQYKQQFNQIKYIKRNLQ